jgi:thymidylate synthase ThyX
MPYRCQIIADSISPAGKRLTTFEVTYPRFVHSELLTHRMLSRNSSSSRAIPVKKLMDQVRNDPATPVYWGRNQKGMQAAEELTGDDLRSAQREWLQARNAMLSAAEYLSDTCDLHKQIANRLLEPWMLITVLVSATEWENFFKLRCHPAAQPEIRRIAEMMRDAYRAATPQALDVGEWHAPFYDKGALGTPVNVALRASAESLHLRAAVARCARVSYLTHDGQHDPAADVSLADRLAASGHWSPFEHVAQALEDPDERVGNFLGWRQLRANVDPDYIGGPRRG